MENIQDTIQEQQVIQGFTAMPKEALEGLIGELNLRMTARDLHYCQNQYRMRERRNPTVEELHLLDALYTKRTQSCERHGLRSFYTSDPLVAETYADLIAKASHLRRENRPYTPSELCGVLTRSLAQAGKKASVPILYTGHDAALRLLERGCSSGSCAVIGDASAVIGHLNAQNRLQSTPPQATDQLLLLSPAGLTPSAFAAQVASLPIPKTAQLVSIGQNGLLEALLTWDGVYLVQSYLPGGDDISLSTLVTGFTDSLLIRVDGEHALPMRDAATAAGLVASIIGKYTPSNRLTVRRDGTSPLQIETAFLRNFAPTLPADAEVPGMCMENIPPMADTVLQTLVPDGDCALFANTLPDNPIAAQDHHLLAGAVSSPCGNTFRAALLATLYAVNRAVAAGADYNTLTLSKQLQVPQTDNSNLDMGETMAALLGAYRAQAELALPDVNGQFTKSPDSSAHLTVFAAAPKPEKVIPHHFVGAGNNVYWLTPLGAQNAPVDFEDYRKLLRYVHRLCEEGVALSATAIGESGTEAALRVMMQNGFGLTAVSAFPNTSCGFLIETKEPIQGALIGVTTAFPMLRIGEQDTATVSYRLPHIPADKIPMSEIGTAHPIICLPQTRALGTVAPIQAFVKKHDAILKTVPLFDTASRAQLTELANTMAVAQITVIVGTGEELETILSNRRVRYAQNEMLAHGGLLLCLHTDRAPKHNRPIPADHPFFFGTPAVLTEGDAITFDEENDRMVHMRADSIAIPRMLACGLAYFR